LSTSGNSRPFNSAAPATRVFTQTSPNINLNPLSNSTHPNPGNNAGIGTSTRRFAYVITDANGYFTGTIVAQGNGLQAGLGSLSTFQAVFTGSFTIKTSGAQTIYLAVDDCYTLGVGGGASWVSGPPNSPPTGVTPFELLGVVAAGCWQNGIPNTVVVNFPAAGVYQYELDYSECCSGPLFMSMTLGSQSTSIGLPPTGSLSLTPISPSSLPTGQTQSFTAQVIDASVFPLQYATFALAVNGAN